MDLLKQNLCLFYLHFIVFRWLIYAKNALRWISLFFVTQGLPLLLLVALSTSLHREHSPYGEGSLYGWPLVLTRCYWTVSIHTKDNIFSSSVKSNLVKMETSLAVILPPTVSVLCSTSSLEHILVLFHKMKGNHLGPNVVQNNILLDLQR